MLGSTYNLLLAILKTIYAVKVNILDCWFSIETGLKKMERPVYPYQNCIQIVFLSRKLFLPPLEN